MGLKEAWCLKISKVVQIYIYGSEFGKVLRTRVVFQKLALVLLYSVGILFIGIIVLWPLENNRIDVLLNPTPFIGAGNDRYPRSGCPLLVRSRQLHRCMGIWKVVTFKTFSQADWCIFAHFSIISKYCIFAREMYKKNRLLLLQIIQKMWAVVWLVLFMHTRIFLFVYFIVDLFCYLSVY